MDHCQQPTIGRRPPTFPVLGPAMGRSGHQQQNPQLNVYGRLSCAHRSFRQEQERNRGREGRRVRMSDSEIIQYAFSVDKYYHECLVCAIIENSTLALGSGPLHVQGSAAPSLASPALSSTTAPSEASLSLLQHIAACGSHPPMPLAAYSGLHAFFSFLPVDDVSLRLSSGLLGDFFIVLRLQHRNPQYQVPGSQHRYIRKTLLSPYCLFLPGRLMMSSVALTK